VQTLSRNALKLAVLKRSDLTPDRFLIVDRVDVPKMQRLEVADPIAEIAERAPVGVFKAECLRIQDVDLVQRRFQNLGEKIVLPFRLGAVGNVVNGADNLGGFSVRTGKNVTTDVQ